MPEDDDFGDFGGDEGGGDGESSDSSGSPGGFLKRFLSGAILRILLFVAAGIGVVIIAVITASIVVGGKMADSEEVMDRQRLEQRARPLAGFDLREFMVGTADRDSQHFVRLKLSLAYEPGNMALQNELTERRRQIHDVIILALNTKTREELHSARQKEEFKQELIKRINAILQDGEISDIYYDDFMLN